MRQMYTSPRFENVERVVAMFNEAGIETTIVNRKAYAGHDYKGPSYASPPQRDTWPQVWVVHSNDQARARALLREAGIEPPVRYAEELDRDKDFVVSSEKRRSALVWRFRAILLAGIGFIFILYVTGILN